jgi:hypothetical protein
MAGSSFSLGLSSTTGVGVSSSGRLRGSGRHPSWCRAELMPRGPSRGRLSVRLSPTNSQFSIDRGPLKAVAGRPARRDGPLVRGPRDQLLLNQVCVGHTGLEPFRSCAVAAFRALGFSTPHRVQLWFLFRSAKSTVARGRPMANYLHTLFDVSELSPTACACCGGPSWSGSISFPTR